MKQNKFILAATLFLLIPNIAYAAPTISSEESQNFTQNDGSTQLRAITVTEDSSQAYIKAGVLKITIPAYLSIIFDQTRTKTEIFTYGTAVDSGKVKSSPEITFENKDKTLVIPIDQDFAVGEKLVITKVFVEGFNTAPANSDKLIMEINGTQYLDNSSLYIFSSSKEDGNAPSKPTDIKTENLTDGSIKISWTDPTDLDLQYVQILRGRNTDISGTSYEDIKAGTQEFIDTEVSKGDKMEYVLRATDGRNYSAQSSLLEITAGETPKPDDTITPSPDTGAEADAGADTEIDTDTDTDTSATHLGTSDSTCQNFTDITSEDAFCAALKNVNQNNILIGYPDGTFKGDNQINRAELLKLVTLFANTEIASPPSDEPIFADIPADAWYVNYVYTAKKLGIVNGYTDGTFKPYQAANKAETVKIILEVLMKETEAVSVAPYEDTEISQNNAWYLPYAQYMKENIDKTSDIFNPGHLMTRREVVEMLDLLQK